MKENEVLIRLFSELAQALGKLKQLAQTPKDVFLVNFEKIDSAKYNFIVAIEAAIDICNHIIADQNLGTPEEYSDVFRIMGEAEVFDSIFVERLVDMVKFRNLLVHVYWKVDEKRLYQILKDELADFERFNEDVRKFLTSGKKSNH
jgi:uncharacterized protein YutE (UPF0331/DUF86 family)